MVNSDAVINGRCHGYVIGSEESIQICDDRILPHLAAHPKQASSVPTEFKGRGKSIISHEPDLNDVIVDCIKDSIVSLMVPD